MTARGHAYDNSSASGNARAHFGNSYTGDLQAHSYGLSNNQGNININYAADADVAGPERNRRLLTAAAEKQTPRVIALLRLNADVEVRDEQGLTALHHAVLGGDRDVVRVLLEHGADINARTAQMGSPLCLASLKGDLCLVQALLDARANVDLSDGPFGTALHCACYNGNLAVARALVEKGALLDIKCPLDFEHLDRFCCPPQGISLGSSGATPAGTSSGEAGSIFTETWSPLFLAAWRGSSDVLRILLEAGCQVNRPCGVVELTSLMVAAMCGNVTVGRILMQNNAHVNAQDLSQRTALHYASEHDHEEFAKLLLGGRAQLEALDNASRTPTLVAAASRRTAIVRFLVGSGANLTSTDGGGNTLLSFAMQDKSTQMAQILADEATKRRGSWRSRLLLSTFDATAKEVFECIVSASEANGPQRLDPIHIAAKKGLANAIPILHSLGARATHIDEQAWTAAHHAAQNGNLIAFRHVLELGADLDASTYQRETALAIASRAGHAKIVRDALERGADPDVRNTLGLTPLHLSAGSGHARTVEILASKAVNPSAKSIAGDTALHHASRGGHSLLFPVLLGKGLDPKLPNNAGRTAFDDALDTKTHAALLDCYRSGLLPTPATKALAVRAAPRPPPATTLTTKPQSSAPVTVVQGSSVDDVFQGLAFLVMFVVVIGIILMALPAILVACVQMLGVIAILGTFWVVMPDPSSVAGGGFEGALIAIVEGFFKVFIVFASLAIACVVGKALDAPGILVICMLGAFPWLGLYWWAVVTEGVALGPIFLAVGLVGLLIYGLSCLNDDEKRVPEKQMVVSTK